MVVHNVAEQNAGPADWFKSLPFVTQYWFGATVVLTLCGNFGVISPYQFLWMWDSIKNNFELWRVLTCFCYAGPFDFDTLILVCTCVNATIDCNQLFIAIANLSLNQQTCSTR